VTGGEFPAAAEAAAEGSSSAEGFPARKKASWSSSCSRRRGSYWSGWIGRRRGGRTGSTGTKAHRRRGSDGEVVPVAGVPKGGEEVAGKLLWDDVVLLVPLVGAGGLFSGESTLRPSDGGAGACRCCGRRCSGVEE
jgi:hypothetical protein